MSDKIFHRILTVVVVIGILSVAALICYTVYLYDNCSIISYIANGR